MRGASAIVGIAAVSAALCVGSGSRAAEDGARATAAFRLNAIRRAGVWTPTNVRAKDLAAGPAGPEAFAPHAIVHCTFVPRAHGRGSTRKFDCALPSGRRLKVRYGANNGEVYAQVAATRLLWALGFDAHRMYPVVVACRGCPADPFKDQKVTEDVRERTFDPATIEVKAEGVTVETKPDEGWSWHELAKVDEAAGGAPPRERDGLTLLAVLLQHSSNKAINQRIVCLDEPRCAHTRMLIADLGKTFGAASLLNDDHIASVNFKEWSTTPVWKQTSGCVGNLAMSLTGTLHYPTIGEKGRAFLSDLLAQLSDRQLHDLFTVARFSERDHSATIEDWVTAFKRKRQEIASRNCQIE
jgi:hypothetical protein